MRAYLGMKLGPAIRFHRLIRNAAFLESTEWVGLSDDEEDEDCVCGKPLVNDEVNVVCSENCKDREHKWYSEKCRDSKCISDQICHKAHSTSVIACIFCRNMDHTVDCCAHIRLKCETCNEFGHHSLLCLTHKTLKTMTNRKTKSRYYNCK